MAFGSWLEKRTQIFPMMHQKIEAWRKSHYVFNQASARTNISCDLLPLRRTELMRFGKMRGVAGETELGSASDSSGMRTVCSFVFCVLWWKYPAALPRALSFAFSGLIFPAVGVVICSSPSLLVFPGWAFCHREEVQSRREPLQVCRRIKLDRWESYYRGRFVLRLITWRLWRRMKRVRERLSVSRFSCRNWISAVCCFIKASLGIKFLSNTPDQQRFRRITTWIQEESFLLQSYCDTLWWV